MVSRTRRQSNKIRFSATILLVLTMGLIFKSSKYKIKLATAHESPKTTFLSNNSVISSTNDLSDGLVAYYSFNAGTAVDDSGTGNDGTMVGPPEVVDGIITPELRFGGYYDPDYINVPNSETLTFIDNFTFSLWFSIQENTSMSPTGGGVTEYGLQALIAKSGDRNGLTIRVHRSIEDGDWYLRADNGLCCSSAQQTLEALEGSGVGLYGWHMATVTHGNGVVRLYLDGDLMDEKTVSEFNLNPATATQPIHIGIGQFYSGINWYPFNGMLDEVRIYDRALDKSEVQELYDKADLPNPIPIDISISLYSNPSTEEEKTPYETIINHFADGVYEQSNGSARLRNVQIYTQSREEDTADILWEERCHPSSRGAGFGIDGYHIVMCDICEGCDTSYLESEFNQKKAGYILAHEWGHYYYSLFDEYNEDVICEFTFPWQPCMDDVEVEKSIMNDSSNALYNENYYWLNFSTYLNAQEQTAQFRVYEASGWDTITRPISEDRREWWHIIPVHERIFREEVVYFKPIEGETRIELPGSARSELNPIWMDDTAANEPAGSVIDHIYASLNSLEGGTIYYPEPIPLIASANWAYTIAHAEISGTVKLPDDSVTPVAFLDDGVPPDAAADDGIYSALLSYDQNGVYTFDVQFENTEGNAQFVADAFLLSTGVGGIHVPMPDPVPISENFLVTATLQLTVTGVVADDYGNTVAEAYNLSPTNIPLDGKFEYAGDLDMFRVATPPNGLTYIRVSNVALGANPQVRVFGSDGRTVLHHAAISSEYTCGGYLFIPVIEAKTNSEFYVELSDVDHTNYGGLYQVSVGTLLTSERSCMDGKIIHLPIIIVRD
ncbi:LamG domain-containing protein [Chloroflexota bacterium]